MSLIGKGYNVEDWRTATKTNVAQKTLQELASQLVSVLDKDFVCQPQVRKLMLNRQKMANGELPIDWGFAETLAYASLLTEGYPVRLSGEDIQRGTFAHRHAVLHNLETDEEYIPLNHLTATQAKAAIYNSILSEYAVMGFEAGYAAAAPDELVIWEAQYGDFANTAQADR